MMTYTDSDQRIRWYSNGTLSGASIPFPMRLSSYISAGCSSIIGYAQEWFSSGATDYRFGGSLRDYRVYKTPLRCARSTMAGRQFGKVTLVPSTLQLLTCFAPFPAWFVVAPLR